MVGFTVGIFSYIIFSRQASKTRKHEGKHFGKQKVNLGKMILLSLAAAVYMCPCRTTEQGAKMRFKKRQES
jgi:hypothetical protein